MQQAWRGGRADCVPGLTQAGGSALYVRPLVVELRAQPEPVQDLVGVLEVGGIGDRPGESRRRAQRRVDVEVDGGGAERGEDDPAAAVPDRGVTVLAAEAAERLGARLRRDGLHGLL